LSRYEHERELYNAAVSGAVVVTVNRRLARTLSDDYARRQKESGLKVWERPQINTFDGWLRGCVAAVGEDGFLLTGIQADCLWQQIIRADLAKSGMALMQVQTTAKMVAQAHRSLHDAACAESYNFNSPDLIDAHPNSTDSLLSPTYYLSPECKSFLRWQTQFVTWCKKRDWIDPASLSAYVSTLFRTGMIHAPQRLLVYGFDQLNAAQTALFAQLQHLGTVVDIVNPPVEVSDNVTCVECGDESSEIAAAARWSRLQLERRVGTVAVVVPDLTRVHAQVERIFAAELKLTRYPELVPVANFNVSLGMPLIQHGMITTALMLLSVPDEVDFETISYLLRSPWLNHGVSAAATRAHFESWLRKRNVHKISLKSLTNLCCRRMGHDDSFLRLLEQLILCRGERSDKSLIYWADYFADLLNGAGWPGERALSSDDYQVLMAWREKLLPAFVSLNVIHPPTDFSTAVALLKSVAKEHLFQPQAQDDRLQVVGLLESAGLHFDAMWVTGLTDGVLPGQVQYNPFLPVELQRKHQMPHSSIEHENHYAKLTLQRLLSSAEQVILSYPAAAENVSLAPSPFIQYPIEQYDAFYPAECVASQQTLNNTIEHVCDEVGAALVVAEDTGDVEIRGGTSVLKEQSLCPFRAYIHHRLRVRALESPQPGLDGRMRGNLIHKVLELFWRQVSSQQQLCALGEDKLRNLVTQVTARVLGQQLGADNAELLPLEVQRLSTLLFTWLSQYEISRSPFTIVSLEQRRPVCIGALKFDVIPDRIDRLGDGDLVVIDYKSSLVSNADLVGEKLLEPQLPIYALYGVEDDLNAPVATVFAQIRAGECAFKGVACADGLIAGVKGVAKSGSGKRQIFDWTELLDDWRRQLHELSEDFVAARAQVKPANKQACSFCDLRGLCKIEVNT